MVRSRPNLPIQLDVPLARFTTMKVGGCAAFFLEAGGEDVLREALRWAESEHLPVAVLGGGSNIIVGDSGFSGLVIRITMRGMESFLDARGRVRLRVAAGEALDTVVSACVDEGWAGIECLSGIPGTVGAAPVQNVGAYGQEIGSTIVEVEAVDRSDLRSVRLDRASCGFAYRDSVLKRGSGQGFVITSVVLELVPGGEPKVVYPELVRALAVAPEVRPALGDVRRAILGLRRAKSMLVDVDDPNRHSCGSFFLNPVVSPETADAIEAKTRVGEAASCMPRFEVHHGVKLSAAWLIERAGFSRGLVSGNAGISTRHALALVNRGEATAREILHLAGRIRAEVHARFGVRLAYEPVFWGLVPDERSVLGLE